MKEICKNCIHAAPTYKGVSCDIKGKKVKAQDTCERYAPKGGRR